VVSDAGDVDGDGLDDIMTGAYGTDSDPDSGSTYVVLGSSLGGSPNVQLANADYIFTGENSEDYSGFDISSAGDVDADGFDDILVGAPYNDDAATGAGKAYLILGGNLPPTPSTNLSLADYGFIGESNSDYAGYSVSEAGDVNGDGLDDILIGAYLNDDGASNAGKAYLLLSNL